MALRVLLADESSTIKKVMQLALQDFAVEVKAVQVGIDVLDVTKQFKPDVIFIDVLLQKKNGYEVAAELKSEPSTSGIPIVLMWSSFMDLDEKQFAQCRANGRLEKPFDVESLRGLVRDLVPRTQSHRLANFLQFPDSFAEPLTLEEENKSQQTPPAPSQQKGDRWNMESFADISEFTVENPPETDAKPAVKTRGEAMAPSVAPSPITLSSDDDEDFEQIDLGMLGSSSPNPSVPVAAASGKKTAPPPPELPPLEPDPELEFTRTGELPPIPDATGISSDPSEAWSQQSLSRFKIPLPPVAVESEDLSLVLDDRGQLDSTQPLPPPPTHLEMPSDLTVEALPERDENLELTNFSGDARGGVSDRLSADELERIIRAQSKEIIESVVARIVPDMASEMIRKELERLLKENGELR